MKSREQEYPNGKRLWSKEEDNLLISIVGNQTSPKWTFISQEFNQKIQKNPSSSHIFRTNKQCRQRWQNHLNPQLNNHAPWSEDQHRTLFKLFNHHSHQWCELATKLQSQGFPRRGENNIKNYFYTAIKRQIKKMNQIIKENNRATKRKKSQINQYRKKYSYNPRLSLQRQILVKTQPQQQKILVQTQLNQSTNSLNNENPQNCSFILPNLHTDVILSPKYQNTLEMSIQQVYYQLGNLHIIKQLNYDLISKILLIAQEKANKKYIISSHQTKQCHEMAERLRNQFIQLIMQRVVPLDRERVLQLSIKMLKVSRRCKKKINKTDDFQQFYVEESHTSAKKKTKCQYQKKVDGIVIPFPQIDKYFRFEGQKLDSPFLDLGRSIQFSGDEQPCNNLNIKTSVDLGQSSFDRKNLENENLFNSSFLQVSRKKSNDVMQNFSENRYSQFMSNIRNEEQYKLGQFPKLAEQYVQNQNLFVPNFELQRSFIQNRIITNLTIPSTSFTRNNSSSENEAQPNFLTYSWAYSSQALDRKNSVDRNLDEIGFNFSKQNFSQL